MEHEKTYKLLEVLLSKHKQQLDHYYNNGGFDSEYQEGLLNGKVELLEKILSSITK